MKLKLVLFGRGVGEGVLCNYDSDEWVIVDSCYGKNNSEKKAAALEYLEEHSISFEKVKLIVISHFHDDHIKGMLDIVRHCTSARIFVPEALSTKEFVTYIATIADVNSTTAPQQGVSEIFNIFYEAHNTGREIERTRADVSLYFNQKNFARVSALSPSNLECQETLAYFIEQVKTLNESVSLELPANVKKKNINNNCITLCISGNVNSDILLGADLEVSTNLKKGWSALAATQLAPKNTASVFKISHHGSVNGYCPVSWSKLAVTNTKPIGILTPYSRQNLPRAEQIEVLQAVTSELYSTSPIKEYPLNTTDKKVLDEKRVESIARINLNFGYIELNEVSRNGSSWYDVKTVGAALKLQ